MASGFTVACPHCDQIIRIYVQEPVPSKPQTPGVTQREYPLAREVMSGRLLAGLEKNDIETIGDVMKVTEAELLATPNFGRVSLAELKAIMVKHGRHIGEDL